MLDTLGISEAASAIRNRVISPRELVESCLEQIRTYDDRLHAWVLVDEEGARRAAAELETEPWRGPLHGIPLGIKDIIDVEGLPTRAGSPLGDDRPAAADAPLVAALRGAGAIILGKTVTVEFACFDPSPTRNPWDPVRSPHARYTPGGSSSGSAAAVAPGMCLGAIGTQTGGSLVRPAAYCGVATCKPTFGSVDTEGIVPVSRHFDQPGPMARTAADVEILLKYLLGTEESQPIDRTAPPRLGVVEEFFMEGADAAVAGVVRAAMGELRRGGASLEPTACGVDFGEIGPLHRRIMAVDAAAYHRERFATHRSSYGPLITALLDEGLKIAAVDYAEALDHQRRFRRRIDAILAACTHVDALVMPATDTTAPATLTTTGTPKFQAPWSYAGVPTVAIPCGLAGDGMPVGLQLVGRRDQESALLAVARWCERQLAFAATAPLVA